jgi:hypothetical protein
VLPNIVPLPVRAGLFMLFIALCDLDIRLLWNSNVLYDTFSMSDTLSGEILSLSLPRILATLFFLLLHFLILFMMMPCIKFFHIISSFFNNYYTKEINKNLFCYNYDIVFTAQKFTGVKMSQDINIKTMSEMFPIDKEASRSKQGAKVLEGLLSKFKKGGSNQKAMEQFSYLSRDASAVERGAVAGKGVHMMNRPGKVLDKSNMKFPSSAQKDRAKSVVAQHGLNEWAGNAKAGSAFKKVREEALSNMMKKVPAKANKKAFFSKAKGATTPTSATSRFKNHAIDAATRRALVKTANLFKVAQEVDQGEIDRINELGTASGNAKDKGIKGALMGAMGGAAYGISRGKTPKSQIPLALWHAIPGAVVGGTLGTAAGYVGRKISPLSDREKMKMYDDATSTIS